MRSVLKWVGVCVLGFTGVLTATWIAIGPEWRALLADPPRGQDVLFWKQGQRDAAFRMIDRLPMIVKSRPIAPSPDPRRLEVGPPLTLEIDLDGVMQSQRNASLVVVHNGKIRLERYGLGFGPEGRWTSFSVAKSFTSTLVGAAVRDGAIKSLDDKVSNYVPQLVGSAYDDVSIRQLLTMTSGVDWHEDYEDPQSDVAQFNMFTPEPGTSQIAGYMAGLGRAHSPGIVWNYSTGETNLIGVLVSEATGRTLSDYIYEKIWKPAGMEGKASWLLGVDGQEISGCCIQATTRDFARFGLFILDGGVNRGASDEDSVFPEGWVHQATIKQVDIGAPGQGYGFQWWTFDDGSFQADGIFGQGIFIDPSRQLVIASNASWTSALGERGGEHAARAAFYRSVQAAIDAEQAAARALP